MQTKVSIIGGIEYTYVSLDENMDFFCDRCKRNKKSKKYAEYFEHGTKKKICNGCYGAIYAKNKQQPKN